MSPRSIGLNEHLHAYLLRWGIREHDELRAIRDELALGAPAFAEPSNYGKALRAAAEAGHITPRGVWDGK